MHLVGGGQGLFGGEAIRIGGHRLLECRLSCGLLGRVLVGGGLVGGGLVGGGLGGGRLDGGSLLSRDVLVGGVSVCRLLLGSLLGRLFRSLLILNRAAECVGGEPVLCQGFAGTLIAEFGDPTLQAGITTRIHGDVCAEFRILVGDFCQQNRVRVRILYGSDRSIIINHGITSLCSLGYAERMVRSVCSVASSMAPMSSPSSSLKALNA